MSRVVVVGVANFNFNINFTRSLLTRLANGLNVVWGKEIKDGSKFKRTISNSTKKKNNHPC